MIISPKIRNFLCATAHPLGCHKNVEKQIEYILAQQTGLGPKNVLIIGASAGYGLATRIVSTFGYGAATLGVFFERPYTESRTATAGWYNTAAFETMATEKGYYAKSINGDAFSDEVKIKTIETIKKDLGKIDLVVYSLAAPRRNNPRTGTSSTSVLKPIGKPYTGKTVDVQSGEVYDITIEPANDEEIKQTVDVMGGEDWQLWIEDLYGAGVLEEGVVTIAYSYLGPQITYPIYREGTIGRAKDHLESTAVRLTQQLETIQGKAYVSVNKALVTQASSAIPVVPLYISIMLKVMKEKGIDESCIEQAYRLFAERIYCKNLQLDDMGRIRIDDLEMREDVQTEIIKVWNKIETNNINDLSDLEGYRQDFLKLFGFGFSEIDYNKDLDHCVDIPGLI
jgi:enoyl-[acyl-carrier protein] reductase / trans-2-enoyl-CoA reductase (NAD+)